MDALLQLGLQVPVVSIICLVVWKLGVLAITKWSESDGKRTDAMAKGFADITSHLGSHGERLARMDEKLDNLPSAMDSTLPRITRLRGKRK